MDRIESDKSASHSMWYILKSQSQPQKHNNKTTPYVQSLKL
jgi:hypothetical protein